MTRFRKAKVETKVNWLKFKTNIWPEIKDCLPNYCDQLGLTVPELTAWMPMRAFQIFGGRSWSLSVVWVDRDNIQPIN